jgi:hypothetical protein
MSRLIARCLCAATVVLWTVCAYPGDNLSVATFDIDATPPMGSMMSYDRVRKIDEMGLRCRGIVILGAQDPIVLCSVDWLGIGNQAHDIFRLRIAEAAGTRPERVAVHTIHQHDAPVCDFGAESLLNQVGKSDLGAYDGSFARRVIDNLAAEIRASIAQASPITHAGFGSADVQQVASNRRIQDSTGMVIATRYTATKDAELRARDEGLIDPALDTVSFWNGETPVVVLSYYACHPQSYYRTGIPSPDFPGLARFFRSQDAPGPLYVHFNGAGGNLGAGKYNDGSPQNRLILANRVSDAMRRSFEATKKFPIAPSDIQWTSQAVSLPPAKHLNRDKLAKDLEIWQSTSSMGIPDRLAWLLRCQAGHPIDVSCLAIGKVRVLHLPGELFVEYQLAAKAMRPDLNVTMAAYGDYGPAYIGTAKSYEQGGYEVSERATNVGPEAEAILMGAMKKLLESTTTITE